MRALQHYTDLKDLKRVIVNTHAIDPQVSVVVCGLLGVMGVGTRWRLWGASVGDGGGISNVATAGECRWQQREKGAAARAQAT
jgi:hypothetical protein